jgi:hypothetical protein
MNRFRLSFELIWRTCSGETAWQTVADLSRFHRIQASPGYRQAAQLLHQRLAHDGLAAEILSFPADEGTHFWAMSSFQEWDCREATLHLVAPAEEAHLLADFRACPMSLIQRSAAFDGEAEVVLLQDGEEEADYDGLDVAGKVVLTRGDVRRVWELAVARRGAVGLLFDGMRAVPPIRPEGDLPDARQYTSFWWGAGDLRCFGFVLTQRGRNPRRRPPVPSPALGQRQRLGGGGSAGSGPRPAHAGQQRRPAAAQTHDPLPVAAGDDRHFCLPGRPRGPTRPSGSRH